MFCQLTINLSAANQRKISLCQSIHTKEDLLYAQKQGPKPEAHLLSTFPRTPLFLHWAKLVSVVARQLFALSVWRGSVHQAQEREVHQNAIEISQIECDAVCCISVCRESRLGKRANELKERDGCTSSRISSACVYDQKPDFLLHLLARSPAWMRTECTLNV